MAFAVMIGGVVIGTIQEKNVNDLNALLAKEMKKRFAVKIVKLAGSEKKKSR